MSQLLRRLTWGVFVLFAVGVAWSAVAAGSDGTQDRVTGTGHLRTELPTGVIEVKLHVEAQSGPSGENPSGFVTFKGNPPPIGPLEFRGRVTCLNVIGNQATVGLVITSVTAGPVPVGAGGLFSIADLDGVGGPDAFEGFPLPAPPAACPPPFGGRPVSAGNFVVRDAAP